MDTLALLCNLHADGPATLQRLRREGCESLDTLLALEIPRLSQCLDWNEEFSQRFLREAVLLAERLGETVAWEISEEVIEEFEQDDSEVEGLREPDPFDLPESSETPEQHGAAEDRAYTVDGLVGEVTPVAADETAHDGQVESLARPEVLATGSEPGSEEEYEYVLVEEELIADAAMPEADPASVKEVLGAWRDLDESDPPPAPDESRMEHEVGVSTGEPDDEARDDSSDEPGDEGLRDYVVDPGQASPNRPLARVELPGLDRKLVHRLAQLGIHSLGGLVEAPTTALARRLPMPFTRLRRLQFLARRELARVSSAPQPGGLPTARSERGGPGSASAGPFA